MAKTIFRGFGYGGMTTPASGSVNEDNIYGTFGGFKLDWVNDALTNNWSRRDYDLPRQQAPLPSPSPPETLPHPHPMYPLEYWKGTSTYKREHYNWLLQRPVEDERHRLSIDSPRYWECEAKFWRLAWIKRRDRLLSEKLEPAVFWKAEAGHWKQKCMSVSMEIMRNQIDDPAYWEAEHRFYDDLLETLSQRQEELIKARLMTATSQSKGADELLSSTRPHRKPSRDNAGLPPRRSMRIAAKGAALIARKNETIMTSRTKKRRRDSLEETFDRVKHKKR